MVGDWQIVEIVTPPPTHPSAEVGASGGSVEGSGMSEVKTEAGEGEGSRKRPAEVALEDEEDGRSWKLRKKTVGPGLGEIYDPGVIAIKIKPKKEDNGGSGLLTSAAAGKSSRRQS